MQPLCSLAFAFLCSLSFLSAVLSIQCNKTQYEWPVDKPEYCCSKCPPGRRLARRSVGCDSQCEPCMGERYSDTYNVDMDCNICDTCNRLNMEYKSHCNATHNAVCRCKAGYECKDQACKKCVPIPTTIKPTLTPFITALTPGPATTLWTTHKQIRDTAWFLVIIVLLSAAISFVVLTKIKPFLHWIRSNYDNLLAERRTPVPSCCEEEVSKPVQEAGNMTNHKTDPELGLTNISQVDIE